MPRKLITLAALSMLLGGCTSYTPGSTLEERIVQRYEQNIILDSDSSGRTFVKCIKHGTVDLCSLFFAEFWYSRVENTYMCLKREWDAEQQAENAWQEFRKKHIGHTKNQLIIEFGKPDATESDGADGTLLIYENSMQESESFISLAHSMYGSGLSYINGRRHSAYAASSFGGFGHTHGRSSTYGFSRIQRIWFALGKDGKVYSVNRREATSSK